MSEHCPGCRNSDPTPQKIDPLGVMNPSHGTMSKTAPHIALEQLRALGAMKKKPVNSNLATKRSPAEQRRADRTLRRMLRAMRPKK